MSNPIPAPEPVSGLAAVVAELSRRIDRINVRLDARGELARLASLPDLPLPDRPGLRLVVNPGKPRRTARRASLRVVAGGAR